MTNIITYPVPLTVIVSEPFSNEYLTYVESGDEVLTQLNSKDFEKDDKLIAIAQIKCSQCVSGFAYIIVDAELEISFIFDIGLFKTSNLLN